VHPDQKQIAGIGVHDGDKLATNLSGIEVARKHPSEGVLDEARTGLLDPRDRIHADSDRMSRAM
jgi:hypothetical protein